MGGSSGSSVYGSGEKTKFESAAKKLYSGLSDDNLKILINYIETQRSKWKKDTLTDDDITKIVNDNFVGAFKGTAFVSMLGGLLIGGVLVAALGGTYMYMKKKDRD